MADVNLIGSSHYEPRVSERVREAVEDGDFDQIFVEGVDAETGQTVEKYVDKWVNQLSENIGMAPVDETEDGRFEEAKAVENAYDGEIVYLDSAKTAFLDAKGTVTDTLRQVSSGEITGTPAKLLKEGADQQDFESVMRVYTPDPDLVYSIFTGDMSDEEYIETVEEGMVGIFQAQYREAGRELPEEREQILRENIRNEAPDQGRLKELMVQDVYQDENIQEREETWMETFDENYDGGEVAVFTGIAHTDENEDTFYNKLLEQGYEVDRKALRGLQPF